MAADQAVVSAGVVVPEQFSAVNRYLSLSSSLSDWSFMRGIGVEGRGERREEKREGRRKEK